MSANLAPRTALGKHPEPGRWARRIPPDHASAFIASGERSFKLPTDSASKRTEIKSRARRKGWRSKTGKRAIRGQIGLASILRFSHLPSHPARNCRPTTTHQAPAPAGQQPPVLILEMGQWFDAPARSLANRRHPSSVLLGAVGNTVFCGLARPALPGGLITSICPHLAWMHRSHPLPPPTWTTGFG